MNTLEGQPILDHSRKLLATGEQAHAWAILHDFFDCFGKEGASATAWYVLAMALGNDSKEIAGKDRSSMIFFYECSLLFFNAVHELYKNQQCSGRCDTDRG